MKREILKHTRDLIALGVIALLAVLIGGYILSNQRFYLPAWVPIVGSDFVDYYAQFSTAQAVTPGQGQTVIVAGVTIGEIGGVTLKNGTAMVEMKIREKYAHIYKDATALLRPKTGLNDMVIELNPGSTSSGEIARGGTLPIARTLPNVNPDQILAGLDTDTRAYLQMLVNGGGEGLNDNSNELSATLKRFDPITVYLAQIGKEMGRRQAYIKQGIHNFRLLTEELGARDTQLARWVRSSNDVFAVFADQQNNLRSTLSLLPGALDATNSAVIDSNALTNQMGPALKKLQPAAVGTAASLKSLQLFAEETTPVFEDQLRPFTAEAGPTVAALRPAAADLAATTPQLDKSFSVLNTLTNELAYNPPGAQEGYLYWLAWGNHLSANMLSAQDSGGPIRRGTLFSSCDALTIYEDLGKGNPELGTLIELLNAPKVATVCAPSAAAAQVARGKQLGRRSLEQQRANTPGAQTGSASGAEQPDQAQQAPAAAPEAQGGERR